MKWIRRILASLITAGGYAALFSVGILLVSARGTEVLELPSYYREASRSPLLLCAGAAAFCGLSAGLFAWFRVRMDLSAARRMEEMIQTDATAGTETERQRQNFPADAAAAYADPARYQQTFAGEGNRREKAVSSGQMTGNSGQKKTDPADRNPMPRKTAFSDERPRFINHSASETQPGAGKAAASEKEPGKKRVPGWNAGKTVLQEEDEDD